MGFLDLPFDESDMIERLGTWVKCESPTYDAAAVNRMMDLVSYDLVLADAMIERIPGRMGFGDSIRATFPHKNAGQPGILVSGHFDTVHPIGTLQQNPFRLQDGKLYGPGIQDMKGGNFVALEAMRMLRQHGLETSLPVTFLFTPDEEVGTPSTRTLIEQEALRNKYVLCPEPAQENQGATTGRYAIARYNIRTSGVPSHAGWRLKEGRSAIALMAEKIGEIEAMTSEDCTFSVGVIRGGQWVNCVSSTCDAEVLSMAKTQEDLDAGNAKMRALTGDFNGVKFEVKCGVTRPVWSPELPETMALYNVAKDLAAQIGFLMSSSSQGGGSDANFTGALRIASLCGVGVLGAGLHTLNEHILVSSLLERAKLMAGLFTRLE
ncbi:M20/M25/M40 family metallo-hydrolase [Bartonella sp. HY761]|uniref:M20/M25/M40 family metallo-hydrolase n=1 Tax=Bartonella sp. HY761 TaxID=2979330 RepID=UPI00220A21E1|nr:M20/M25/M40 family metallo-hydrolase [Bartonella sp. HY761]UXN05746.1 M20/M25/M40 family metallo-hydrolase [Bartonella sp. HY761]